MIWELVVKEHIARMSYRRIVRIVRDEMPNKKRSTERLRRRLSDS